MKIAIVVLKLTTISSTTAADDKLSSSSSLLAFLSSTAEKNNLVRDSQHLISFKNSLSDPYQLPSWQPTIYPCNFHDVSCNSSRVSSIELSNFHLDTDFSTVATFLLSLQTLKTPTSPAQSPPPLDFPAALTSLDLSQNSLSGPISDLPALAANSIDLLPHSPPPAAAIPSLKTLDLSHNNISDDTSAIWLLSI
ncbi:brassinosteroid LRR receptor kinase-like [Salvia miltiorrhiza]|uniref:brassinosteroid LRR receptor kinase-like n=1 Tax=Salvia miltiorrhiza TaxID=226208 RepID=UPI0025AC1180|nr:brassinosteroid LRR receptor kinase-like [Salvia miltiorrhiza]